MSQKLSGVRKVTKVGQIRELWKQEESRFHNAKNSDEKTTVKSIIYEEIRLKLNLPNSHKPMIRQTVNILLGYKPKPKTK